MPPEIMSGGIDTMDLNSRFVVSLANIPYNTSCILTFDYKLDLNGKSTRCTVKVYATYCGHQNSTDVCMVKSKSNQGKMRQRRGITPLKIGEEPPWIPWIKIDPEEEKFFDELKKLPKKHRRDLLTELRLLLLKESPSIESEEVQFVMDGINNALSVEREDDIPAELLQGLDSLSTRFRLQPNRTASIVRENVAILVVHSTPQLRMRGMRIPARAEFAENTLELITEENERTNEREESTDETEAVFFLPSSVTAVERRISMVAFRTNRFFASNHSCQLNSMVLSINVENFTSLTDGEMVQIYLKPWKRVHLRNQSRACAYWHFNENGTGYWSQEGCTLIKAKDGMLDLCLCNHLTHFAEVLIHRNVFPESDEKALEIISIIGCCSSLFGLTVIALTAALFKSWRENESNKIWLNLGTAVFILDVCFLVTVFTDFDFQVASCVAVGAALHYSVLATFCWMMVVSILSYRKLVLVFSRELPCKLLFTALFAWGFPFLVIGILFAVNPYAYSGRFEERTPSGKFCYPKGLAFWLSVFGPMAAMWVVNWVLYAIILRSMFATKTNIRRHSSSKDTLRCASISFLLAFLCGIPWVFGFFAYNVVAAYLFSMSVTFQGFVLFLFFILGSNKTRLLWMNLFRYRTRRVLAITSTGRSNKGTNGDRLNLPSNSLSGPDQTVRFLQAESTL